MLFRAVKLRTWASRPCMTMPYQAAFKLLLSRGVQICAKESMIVQQICDLGPDPWLGGYRVVIMSARMSVMGMLCTLSAQVGHKQTRPCAHLAAAALPSLALL